MFRTKEALIPYLLLAAALAGGLLWHESENLPGLGRNIVTGQVQVGGPFTLTDHTGKRVTSADFHGRYMLIYFGYSFCPDVCPTTLGVMAEALDKMGPGKDRVVPIFITIDPERDTPKVLAQYMKAFGPQFVGLTGSAAEIKAVEKEYRVYAAKTPLKSPDGKVVGYGMNHSSVIYLMGPDGRLVSFYDEAISPDDLVKELRRKV
jgi:protein SCO1/2